MSKTKHTPGHLRMDQVVGGWNLGFRIPTPPTFSEYRRIARVGAELDEKGNQLEWDANADRFLALWNACDGIPTEALEGGAVKNLLATLREVSTLADQLQGLLLDGEDAPMGTLENISEAIETLADDAIAKCEADE